MGRSVCLKYANLLVEMLIFVPVSEYRHSTPPYLYVRGSRFCTCIGIQTNCPP
jgi:hypothetical protein